MLNQKLNQKQLAPYLFITPFAILFLVFWIWPIIQSFYISLTDWNGFNPSNFIGFRNYINLINDKTFLIALQNTFVAAIVYIIIVLIISLFIGIVLGLVDLKFRVFFRTAYFLPVTMSLIIVATVFQLIYSKQGGLINSILGLFHIQPIDWLGNGKIALWSIVALRVWRNSGYYSLFIIAGLQNIPHEVYEAAMVDGAKNWDCIKRITLPLLRPMILYVIVTSSIWAFQLFDEPWLLLKGGPGTSTLTLSIYLYQNSFRFFKFGYGSAISYVLTLIMIVFSLVQMKIFFKKS